jgi:hypothetical protein
MSGDLTPIIEDSTPIVEPVEIIRPPSPEELEIPKVAKKKISKKEKKAQLSKMVYLFTPFGGDKGKPKLESLDIGL